MNLQPKFFAFLMIFAFVFTACGGSSEENDNSSNWVQAACFNVTSDNSGYGYSVAICNDTIVVGTLTAAYVFKKEASGNWVQDAYIKASNADTYDYFGNSVAISNDTIVIGAYYEDSSQTIITNDDSTASNDDSASDAGAVYVFKKDASGNWIQDAYLKASNSEAGIFFGNSVAINNDIIVVGAYYEDSSQTTIINNDGIASNDESGANSGAVYIFKKDANGNWIQDAFLKGSNVEGVNWSNMNGNCFFGYSVAIYNDTVVVGAYGENSNQTTITNDDGVASDDNSAVYSGAAYVFKKDASGNWIQDAYLKASNADANDYFGNSVAISNDTIIVGAYEEDSSQTEITNDNGLASNDNSAEYSGAAYVFKKDANGNWIQDAYLKASGGHVAFGYFVAICSDTILVGTGGTAYVFKKDASDNWIQDACLETSDDSQLRKSVAISNDSIVIGGLKEVYVFTEK